MKKIDFGLIDRIAANIDKKGGPPDDGGMDTRIEKLEEFVVDARDRLMRIETRLEQTTTKADLSDSTNQTIKWMITTAAVLGVAAITVMTFVLNNATPKAPGASSVPIIIYSQPAPSAMLAPVPAAAPPAAK